MMNPVLRAALACADKGWPVFPCHPGRKLAATPNGYLDATTDRARIRAWFAAHPELNLAVATGAPGPDVLNVDYRGPDADGYQALLRLHQAGLTQETFACIGTPNGGLHVYFDGSSQRSEHLPEQHIGFLAQGGYVLVPPSQLGGGTYGGINMPGEHAGLDWDAAARVLDPSRTRQRSPRESARTAIGERLSALARRVTQRQAHPEPPDREAGA